LEELTGAQNISETQYRENPLMIVELGEEEDISNPNKDI
jgi:hypothetical protein